MKRLLPVILPLLFIGGLSAASIMEAERLEARFPPVGQFAEVEGVRVHFTDSGEPGTSGHSGSSHRPPIVLIHGASTSLKDFQATLVEPLKTGNRVITFDRPGHGYSELPSGEWPSPADQARLLRGLLAELDASKPLLVGHSWAGSVVLAYLLAYPDEALGGVLLAGGSHAWEGGVAWYNDVASLPVIGPLFASIVPMTAGRVALASGIRSAFHPNPVPDDYQERTGVALTLRPHTFVANATDVRRLSPFLERQQAHYRYIQNPLLLITGDEDNIVPAWNHAERLIDEAPNAELVLLPGIGHGLHHVERTKIANLIDEFSRRASR